MTPDRPRARERGLINLTARLLSEHDLSGRAPREIAEAVVAACYPGTRRIAPARPEVEYGWVDGCWAPVGSETETEHDPDPKGT